MITDHLLILDDEAFGNSIINGQCYFIIETSDTPKKSVWSVPGNDDDNRKQQNYESLKRTVEEGTYKETSGGFM